MSDEVAREVSAEDAIAAKYFPDEPEREEAEPGSETEQPEVEAEAESQEIEEEATGDAPEWAELQLDDISVYTSPEHQEKVKEAFLRWSDYTTKTQETARLRESLALGQQQLEAQSAASQFAQSISEEQQAIALLTAQKSQFDQLNWREMTTDEMVRARHELDQINDQIGQYQKQIEAKQGEFTEAQQKQHQEFLKKSVEYLQREIPGWNDEQANEVAQYALTQGYTDAQISSPYISPVDVKILWKAKQYDALKASTGKARQEAQKAPPPLKPGPTTRANKDKADYLNFKKALKAAKGQGNGKVEKVLSERIAAKFG